MPAGATAMARSRELPAGAADMAGSVRMPRAVRLDRAGRRTCQTRTGQRRLPGPLRPNTPTPLDAGRRGLRRPLAPTHRQRAPVVSDVTRVEAVGLRRPALASLSTTRSRAAQSFATCHPNQQSCPVTPWQFIRLPSVLSGSSSEPVGSTPTPMAVPRGRQLRPSGRSTAGGQVRRRPLKGPGNLDLTPHRRSHRQGTHIRLSKYERTYVRVADSSPLPGSGSARKRGGDKRDEPRRPAARFGAFRIRRRPLRHVPRGTTAERTTL